MTVASKNKAQTKKDETKKTPGQKANSGKKKPRKTPKKNAKKDTTANGAGKQTRERKSSPRKKKVIPDAVALQDAGAKEADPFEVAKQTVKGSVPAIVEAMVEMAKQGSCTHAKTLLEITGAKHMFADEAERQESGEPWAKLVLERLDEAESAEARENAAPADESLAVETQG